MDTTHEELEGLLLDWEAGTLDDDGVSRVREILRDDAGARAFYLRWQSMTAALHLERDAGLGSLEGPLHGEPGPSANSRVMHDNKGRRRAKAHVIRVSYWVAAAAAAVVCLMTARLVYLEWTTDRNAAGALAKSQGTPLRKAQEATSQGLALLTRLVDVTWDPEQTAYDVGDALPPGSFAIESGFAQVEFFCGATVILEGPAELELASSTLARLRNGRLRAQVPPAARGFSLEIDDLKVVDLGTEFGVAVGPEGANVQVFDGEIELHQPDREARLLTAGEAVVRERNGTISTAAPSPMDYVSIHSLNARVRDRRRTRFERWRLWSEQVRRDPRLIAYYAFEGDESWERKLPCDVLPRNSELDGAIVGARPVEGRWSGKQALEFKRPGDRVRVQIPGEFGSLTFASWIRVDSLDRWYNSLFLTDSYNKGEPHWQILDTGQIYFSVRPTERGAAGPRDHKSLSPAFWDPSLSGKWLHIATTYNVEKRTVVHYLNGEVLSRDEIPASQVVDVVRIGKATIGNWASPTMPDASFAIRNLNGRMDEFILLAAALTDEEIKEIYEHGKP